MKFDQLIQIFRKTNDEIQGFILQQINYGLTIRNWIFGFYIVEFEQHGEDRAVYGDSLIKEISEKLKPMKGVSQPQLYRYIDFYKSYPQIFSTVLRKFEIPDKFLNEKLSTLSRILPNEQELSIEAEVLVNRLSFSHFVELLTAETPLKKSFYEIEAIKNNWSVRELKRAMDTLLFERTGLSSTKNAVIKKIKDHSLLLPADVIKNPYILEFLGLEEKPEYSENDLEQAIISHLQKFLVEMGRGFCFEARQKRITFDNEHYFIDLVFYHRILKCHILLDLKIGKFSHADAGQMNLYLNYYKENEMTEGDNPPVGIILCAKKNDAMVRYATGGLAQSVFVSKYLVELPSVELLKRLIEEDTRNFDEK
ncbi:MAG: DUF1016 family protein [Bacteroidales bacterium]|nr:DUF1016 family protein [Bacteroidales bacterium]